MTEICASIEGGFFAHFWMFLLWRRAFLLKVWIYLGRQCVKPSMLSHSFQVGDGVKQLSVKLLITAWWRDNFVPCVNGGWMQQLPPLIKPWEGAGVNVPMSFGWKACLIWPQFKAGALLLLLLHPWSWTAEPVQKPAHKHTLTNPSLLPCARVLNGLRCPKDLSFALPWSLWVEWPAVAPVFLCNILFHVPGSEWQLLIHFSAVFWLTVAGCQDDAVYDDVEVGQRKPRWGGCPLLRLVLGHRDVPLGTKLCLGEPAVWWATKGHELVGT